MKKIERPGISTGPLLFCPLEPKVVVFGFVKTCTVCRLSKDLVFFSARARSPDGLQPRCKDCSRARDSAYYAKNSDVAKARANVWASVNVGKRKDIESRYRKRNRTAQNLRTQNYRARKRAVSDGWDVTPEWWNHLLEMFGGKCGYCRTPGKLTLEHVIPLSRGGLHTPDNVIPACGACNYAKAAQTPDEVGWPVYIPGSDAVRSEARGLMVQHQGLSYQRAIREVLAILEPFPNPPSSMAEAYVTAISREQAASIILKYEWLGTMGRPQACYGLWFDVQGAPALAGAICFGLTGGSRASYVCGTAYSDQSVALERGACVHWAPRNAASWFVSKAVASAAREHGWKVFYAYSDPAANEIGTIYQACNWLYLGVGPGHGPTRETWMRPDGITVSSRTLRYRNLTSTQAMAQGWTKKVVPARGKYVWFEGSAPFKRRMRRLLVHPPQPYPSRFMASLYRP